MVLFREGGTHFFDSSSFTKDKPAVELDLTDSISATALGRRTDCQREMNGASPLE
jgi:hypothetical protein